MRECRWTALAPGLACTQLPPAALHMLHGGSSVTTAAVTALARVYYLHVLLRTNNFCLRESREPDEMRFVETLI